MKPLNLFLCLFCLSCAAPAEPPAAPGEMSGAYALSMRSTLEIEGAAPVQVELRGVWHLVQRGDHIDARIEAPEVSVPDPEEAARLREAFAAPVRLHLAEDALTVRAVTLPEDMEVFAQSTLKALAGYLQRGDGATSPPATEAEQETDTTGRHTVRYRSSAQGLIRDKLHYESSKVQVERGRTLFGADGLRVSESLRFTGEGLLPASRSQTQLVLRRIGPPAEVPGTLGSGLTRYTSALDAGASPWAVQRQVDVQKDTGEPLATLLERAAGEEKRVRDRAWLAMVARLRWSEAAVLEAMELVKVEAHARLLGMALGHASSEASQAALVAMVEAHPERGVQWLSALGHSVRPTPATLEALERRLNDPRMGRQAAYTLGSLAWRVRERRPEQARAVVELLEGRLKAARSQGAQVTALRALGNAGHPRTPALVQAQLGAQDPKLRVEATRALRRVGTEEARRRLEAMTSDRARRVRKAAKRLLQRRG